MDENAQALEIVATPVTSDEPDEGTAIDVVVAFGELGPGALIFEAGLARLFGRHSTSVKRAIDRGELPPPVRLFGKPTWTAASIVGHLQARLDAAAQEREQLERRLSKRAV